MAVSPADAERLAETVLKVYADAQETLLQILARNLEKSIYDPHWAELKLLEVNGLRKSVETVLAQLRKGSDRAIAQVMAAAYDQGGAVAMADLGGDPRPLGHRTNQRAVDAYTRALIDKTEPLFTRIRRWPEDVYFQVVNEVEGRVVTGVQTRREVTAEALSRFADRGVTGFTDRAGRNWQLDSYVEMATRTGAGQAMVEGHTSQLLAKGHGLVMISNAPEECHLCRPWEGEVVALDMSALGVQSDDTLVEATLDEAIAEGLFHPNCRHRTVAYFPGVTRRLTDTADPEGDLLRQRQRAYERRIRQLKRRRAAQAPLDPAAARRTAAKLSAKQAEFKAWRDANGRKNLGYRTAVRQHAVPPGGRTPRPDLVPTTPDKPTPAELAPDPELEGYTDAELKALLEDASAAGDDPAAHEFVEQAARELDRRLAAGGSIIDADRDANAWELGPIRGGQKSQKQRMAEARSDYDDWVYRSRLDAEKATNGNMVRRAVMAEFQRKYGSFEALFTGPANQGFYYASEELLRFWEKNPRLTFAEFAAQAGITDQRIVEAAAKAPGARADAALRAEENYDPARRQQRERERRKRRQRRL